MVFLQNESPYGTYDASYSSQTPLYPPGLDYYPVAPGQIVDVSFTFNNDGTAYWTNDPNSPHYVELQSVTGPGSAEPWGDGLPSELSYLWIDENWVGIVTTEGTVDPGGQGLYQFQIDAPDEPGDYYLYVALYRPHSGEHFSGEGPMLKVRVAGTLIAGTLPTVLAAGGSPYYVTGHISVPAGQQTVIEPGCEFNFLGRYKLIVNAGATLQAIGTETDSIVFTASDHEAGWHGMRFLSASDESELAYCRVEYGRAGTVINSTDSRGGGIYAEHSPITVRHSLIQECRTVVANGSGGGAYFYSSSGAVINQCIFRNNTSVKHGGGLDFSSSRMVLTGNLFEGNTAGSSGGGVNGYGLNATTITGNEFRENAALTGGGMALQSGSAEVSGNTVYENQAATDPYSAGGGMSLINVSGTIHGNTIYDNTVDNFGYTGGGGIYCSGGNLVITENVISQNEGGVNGGGIYCSGGGTIGIDRNDIIGNHAHYGGGIRTYNAYPAISYNTIADNQASQCGGMLNNSTSGLVHAEQNWWGHDSGPYHAVTNPDGLGDAVSDNIAFQPWLAFTPAISEIVSETEWLLPSDFALSLVTGTGVDYGVGQVIEYYFENLFNVIRLILNWPGSELKLTVYRPDSTLYGEWQSPSPPVVAEFLPDTVGTWRFVITPIDIPHEDYPCALVGGTAGAGVVSGHVADESSQGIRGVAVDITDTLGTCVYMTETDSEGRFAVPYLFVGTYTVFIMPPLGYVTENDAVMLSVTAGSDTALAFSLTGLDILPDAQRSYFWRRELNEIVYGDSSGTVPVDSLCRFAQLIRTHFTEHRSHPILSVTVGAGTTCDGQLVSMAQLFNLRLPYQHETLNRESETMVAKQIPDYYVPLKVQAQQQLLALLLNAVSYRVSLEAIASEDSVTVAQVIVYADSLIRYAYQIGAEMGGITTCYSRARDITAVVNAGGIITAGLVPSDVPVFVYKFSDDISPPRRALFQNYPNPFNPVTNISYSLPRATHVTLEVFNILGQRVALLIDLPQTAGEHTVSWDARQHASGVYFYRLRTEDAVETKKMLLLK